MSIRMIVGALAALIIQSCFVAAALNKYRMSLQKRVSTGYNMGLTILQL